MSDKPTSESYWVVPSRFLAGSYPASMNGDEAASRLRLTAFLNAGFDTFFDLTRAGELPQYLPVLDEEAAHYDISIDYHRFDIQDRGLPSHDQVVALLDAIDAALAANRKIYLHCWGGIGRTGTAVGCWLVRHGLTGQQAIIRLNELYQAAEQSSLFPRSPETDAQVTFILNWVEPSPLSGSPPIFSKNGGRRRGVNWHARFLQQAAWTRDLRSYLFGRAGLAQAQRVLEVGCGTGAILSDLPTRSSLHGLDLEASRLAEAHVHAPAAALTCGDALSLPYPAGIFDITFCHFLLLWVSDPLRALLEMKRVTRPGGSILAMAEPDYSHRRDKPDELAPLGRWQAESLRRQGADPALGARLAELFRQAGIPPIETGILRGGGERPPEPGERDLEWAVLEADLAGIVPAQEIQRMKLFDEQAWESGERVLYMPTYFAWGQI